VDWNAFLCPKGRVALSCGWRKINISYLNDKLELMSIMTHLISETELLQCGIFIYRFSTDPKRMILKLYCNVDPPLALSLKTLCRNNNWNNNKVLHPSFDCSQPFCSTFRCLWWFGRTQNKATTRQPGILCGWSGRLEQSTTAHSFGTTLSTFKTMLKTHLFSRSYFTDCFADYEQWISYGALVETLAVLLHLINCRSII